MNSFSWTVKDSNYYFIRNFKDDIYKLKFIEWDGSQTGNFVLDKWLVSLSSVNERHVLPLSLNIFPNPASDRFTIRSQEDLEGNVILTISDQTGRQIYRNQFRGKDLNYGINLENLNLKHGLYILNIKGNNYLGSAKLLIQ
ncbi:MAG: T9SS type A sorting domain-containing protein [Chlorobi bacterium]|nr:T9SS type A sorting domain-containing protein [Chlorobiota bacterium]